MGLRWPALAVVGFCGPALTRWHIVGRFNEIFEKNIPGARDVTRLEPPLLLLCCVSFRGLFVVLRWLLWSYVGYRGPALTILGFCGPALACIHSLAHL